MGDEIQYSHFYKTDYQHFASHLKQETSLLKKWFENNSFSTAPLTAGYELESWLIDNAGRPAAINEAFLEKADNPLLSAELARFNIELNSQPARLSNNVLSDFEQKLESLLQHCHKTAASLNTNILTIGILPSLQDYDLTLKNISAMDRYKALNEQVLSHRHGLEIELDINGEDHLHVTHKDVMLEAAATSLQIHTQVPQELATRYYNASLILSAPMVAVSANSPCLFGRRLWQETRIPVFEQAVPTGGYGGAASGPVQRVSFGTNYVRDSLFECFQENLEHFPILLPVSYQTKQEQLKYLRLHNGTIWRWNRPLIGFDKDNTPHLRIENRVCAAAATTLDNIANIAFYYGLLHYYANSEIPPETNMPFAEAKNNFYRAAQRGLNYKTNWFSNRTDTLQKIILDRLLPEAESGLQQLGITKNDSDRYLNIIEQRVKTKQTGSEWQLSFLNAHQNDRTLLTLNYLRKQASKKPVHEWDFEIESGKN